MPSKNSSKSTQEWQEIATSSSLQIARPLLPVTLKGEDFVLFRDDEGELRYQLSSRTDRQHESVTDTQWRTHGRCWVLGVVRSGTEPARQRYTL